MRLGTLLFAAFVAIVVLCFAYPVALIAQRVRLVYLESAEESLVDTANILAEQVSQAFERGALDVDAWYQTAARIKTRSLDARIYELLKDRVDLDVYVTDGQGRVVFDSRGRETLGEDYSRWLDVSRTLSGDYGARVGSNPKDLSMPRTLFVAAPVRVDGRVVGSLTVVKPTTAVSRFVQRIRPRLFALGAITLGVAVALALLVSLWVTQQVSRLAHYADQVRQGERVPFPKLAKTELRRMGLAFEKMRESLAGQAYIEQYVRALTHEIKSPISAIRGAAEILETPQLDPQRRAHFLGNIQNETQRIQDLVDRMLELAELEVRRALPNLEKTALGPIARTILEAQLPALEQKQLRAELEVPDELHVRGDSFLLHLALSNLIKNAIDFSPRGGAIRVRGEHREDFVYIVVEDEGPGIPDFAIARVFERFYSLERPDTGRKSTGLGLNFVREIAALHHGQVELTHRERGLCARLSLPAH